MAFSANFSNPPFHTDSHPCIRVGGPADCIGGPVDWRAPGDGALASWVGLSALYVSWYLLVFVEFVWHCSAN